MGGSLGAEFEKGCATGFRHMKEDDGIGQSFRLLAPDCFSDQEFGHSSVSKSADPAHKLHIHIFPYKLICASEVNC